MFVTRTWHRLYVAESEKNWEVCVRFTVFAGNRQCVCVLKSPWQRLWQLLTKVSDIGTRQTVPPIVPWWQYCARQTDLVNCPYHRQFIPSEGINYLCPYHEGTASLLKYQDFDASTTCRCQIHSSLCMQGTSEVIFTDPGHGTWLVLVGTLLLASCLQQKYTLVLLLHAHTTVGHTWTFNTIRVAIW